MLQIQPTSLLNVGRKKVIRSSFLLTFFLLSYVSEEKETITLVFWNYFSLFSWNIFQGVSTAVLWFLYLCYIVNHEI